MVCEKAEASVISPLLLSCEPLNVWANDKATEYLSTNNMVAITQETKAIDFILEATAIIVTDNIRHESNCLSLSETERDECILKVLNKSNYKFNYKKLKQLAAKYNINLKKLKN